MRAWLRNLLLLAVMSVSGSCQAELVAELTAAAHSVQADYFGMHVHRLKTKPEDHSPLTSWPGVGVGSLRVWDASGAWLDIAPKAGVWSFEVLDHLTREAATHDASVLYTFGLTPRWASARPDEKCSYGLGCSAEPVRMAHWEEYVRRVVTRYKGRITAYELWNEPNFSDFERDRGAHGFYTGSVAQMVEMARIARQVLDEIDPEARLATPGFVNGPDRLELFLKQGGAKYVQVIAYHFYSRDVLQLAETLKRVREVMQRCGVAHLPLWNTELGLETRLPGPPLPPGAILLTDAEAASRLAQYLIFGAAAGLERFYYYAWDNDISGMVNRKGEHNLRLEAYDKAQHWLAGATTRGCSRPEPGVFVCQIEQAGERVFLVWAEREADYTLKLGGAERTLSIESLEGAVERLPKSAAGIRLRLSPNPVRIVFASS